MDSAALYERARPAEARLVDIVSSSRNPADLAIHGARYKKGWE
jgi:hypothetical protein